ncbi:MAG: DUF255 domain-containing protein [Chitinophagaceae bacterium]
MKYIIVLWAICVPLFLTAKQAPFKNNAKNNIQQEFSKGIEWTEGLTWQQLLDKAKAEHKYIFLDCYATWCGPCKEMEKNVYTNDTVGQYLNQKFISVKVQIDKTVFDDEKVKKWYSDAESIHKNYAISTLPSFLFFSPEGKPLHKAVGYKNVGDFITLANDALNPRKQYYSFLNNYQPGKLDTSELKGLAVAFRYVGVELASTMAAEYFDRISKVEWNKKENLLLLTQFSESPKIQKIATEYLSLLSNDEFLAEDNFYLIKCFRAVPEIKNLLLDHLEGLGYNGLKKNVPLLIILKNEGKAKEIACTFINRIPNDEFYTSENILLLKCFTTNTSDKGFNVFYKHALEVNNVVGAKSYAESVVRNIISAEYYDRYWKESISKNQDLVPWKIVSKVIRSKYGKKMAIDQDTWVRASLYEYFAETKNKYWSKYIRYYIKKVERFGTDTTSGFEDSQRLNNFVFTAILFHSDDKKEINIGLKWMEGVIRRNPKDANNIDTYANLLYKDGRKNEAIHWQEKAVQIAINQREADWLLKSLQANLIKMKRGEPTWIEADKD